MIKNALLASLPLALIAVACIGDPPALTEEQLAAQNEYVLTEAPSPQHELDIRFESRMRLVGYDVSVAEVTPGQAFDVTWYWQVVRRLPADWMLFTHIADAADANRCNADESGENNGCTIAAPLRAHLSPSYWPEGAWVRDPQHITIPVEWHSDQVVFYIGFWSGSRRLSVTAGPSDEDSRGRALSLPIAGRARAHAAISAPASDDDRG